MFKDSKKGVTIYADLKQSVSSGTLRTVDLVKVFMGIIRDTPEYVYLMAQIPAGAMENQNDDFWDGDGADLLQELFDVLDSYAPEGYIFGSLSDDGADFGYWKVTEEKEFDSWQEICDIIRENRQGKENELQAYRKEMENKDFLFESEEELLDDFDCFCEQSDLAAEKILDSLFWSSI